MANASGWRHRIAIGLFLDGFLQRLREGAGMPGQGRLFATGCNLAQGAIAA
jgi:hypothetical protein